MASRRLKASLKEAQTSFRAPQLIMKTLTESQISLRRDCGCNISLARQVDLYIDHNTWAFT